MENPRSTHRFFIALLVAFTGAAVAASIYFHSAVILFGWLAVVTAFFFISYLGALFNVMVWAPVFRLLARLDARFEVRKPRDR